MGSGGGGSAPSQTTSTTKTELPDYVKAPAQEYLRRAEDLSHAPYATYSGTRISPLNSLHNFALEQGRQQLGTTLPAAQQVMSNFATGAYNQPAYIHPYLGPQLPGAGLIPPGYHGYSPLPGMGLGGKGGAMPPGQTPTPSPGTPSPTTPGPLVPTPIGPTVPPAPTPTPTPGTPGAPGDPMTQVLNELAQAQQDRYGTNYQTDPFFPYAVMSGPRDGGGGYYGQGWANSGVGFEPATGIITDSMGRPAPVNPLTGQPYREDLRANWNEGN